MGNDGRSRKSLWGNHTNHYDASGNKSGESHDSIWGNHTNHYDASGNKSGESHDSIWGNHTNHYDASGNKIGESHDSIWGNHTNHYDASGNKIGESHDSIWGNHVDHSGGWHPSRSDPFVNPPPSISAGANGLRGYDGGAYSSSSANSLSGHGGSAYSSKPMRPRSRFGLLGFHLVITVVGTLAQLVAILAIGLLLELITGILGDTRWVDNLVDALTYERMFGVGFVYAWIVACGAIALFGQIRFTRQGDNFYEFAARGLFIGVVALLALGMLGWADGWGAALPAAGMLIGNVCGTVSDTRSNHKAPSR